MIALYDRGTMVAELAADRNGMTRQLEALTEGHAAACSIEFAVDAMVDGDWEVYDLPETSESGRRWTRWTLRRVA
jgi:hypothetical protein